MAFTCEVFAEITFLLATILYIDKAIIKKPHVVNRPEEFYFCKRLLLLDNFFRDKADRKQWFHHYAMLNTRNHQPLLNHWHLYYAELKKFIACFEFDDDCTRVTSGEKLIPQTNSCSSSHQLEQWIYYLGNDQDLAAPLNSFVAANKGIKEVHDMLHRA